MSSLNGQGKVVNIREFNMFLIQYNNNILSFLFFPDFHCGILQVTYKVAS